MATRTALLNGNVINRDTDFSKHIEAVSEPWVISWFAVSSSSVAVWQALVKCERTNGDIIYAVVYNNSAQEISWNGDVFIEIAQELIDNWELMNEDWSEIAEIKVGTMPAKNALKLATKSGSTITDARNMIKKSWELLALINQNIEDIADLDTRVESLEDAAAIDHLEERWLVGELYSMSDILFRQTTPTLANSTVDCKIWDTNSNKQIHIQRIWSWIESNQLKLKVKKVWSPTTSLVVEVRKGVEVDISNSEAYWYWWWNLIASWSISYWDISSSYEEETITLDHNFWWTEWELLDIVLYQTDNIVNASNYYCVACDSAQYSEWFSYVSVNGNTRTRSKLMPYCISEWFVDKLLCKASNDQWYIEEAVTMTNTSYSETASSSTMAVVLFTAPETWYYHITWQFYAGGTGWGSWADHSLSWWTKISWTDSWHTQQYQSIDVDCIYYIEAWTELKWNVSTYSYSSWWGRDFDADFLKYYDIPHWEQFPIYPREVKEIWEPASATLYGRTAEWAYIWWIMLWTSTTAQTGSITLWNAVWYITVSLNWTTIKIPYYWA